MANDQGNQQKSGGQGNSGTAGGTKESAGKGKGKGKGKGHGDQSQGGGKKGREGHGGGQAPPPATRVREMSAPKRENTRRNEGQDQQPVGDNRRAGDITVMLFVTLIIGNSLSPLPAIRGPLSAPGQACAQFEFRRKPDRAHLTRIGAQKRTSWNVAARSSGSPRTSFRPAASSIVFSRSSARAPYSCQRG